MKKKKTNIIKTLLPVVVFLLVLSLLFYFIIQLYDSKTYFDNEAAAIGEGYTIQFAQSLEESAAGRFGVVYEIADNIPSSAKTEEIESFGIQQAKKYDIDCLQFVRDKDPIYRFGEGVGSSTAPEVIALIESGKRGNSSIYKDLSLGAPCIAVYSPVVNNTEVDAVIAYFAVSDVAANHAALNPAVKYYCLAETDGSILESYSADGFKTDVSRDIYTYLRNITENKTFADSIEKTAKRSISRTFLVNIDGDVCSVSCVTANGLSSESFVVNIYSVRDLLMGRYTLYDRLFGAALGLTMLVIVTMIAFFVIKRKSDAQLVIMDEYDPVLGCNSYNKFLRDAAEILARNRYSNYAILYFDINKFTYIREHFDSQTSDAALRYISNVIKKTTLRNETYGHIIDDRFVTLAHFPNMQELGDRIRVIQALISNFEITRKRNYTLKSAIGVYVIDRDKDRDIREMIERALAAQMINKKRTDIPFSVYDPSIRSTFVTEAEIESKMYTALENDEFKILFQPKYNLKRDRIDGAEVLVRWYNAKENKYILPNNFVPLFEVNGFIERLDRFVFTEACRYLKEATSRGEKVVPLSVNVSRVSATQPNFLSFYIKTKTDYGIPDGFITLEFTESFAYQNYDMMEKIVSTLKSNGFKTSIDDFGSGYSSLNILKELQMDELKLDRFFLKPGTDKAKDETLIQTVILLGKSFGMKVTQEGIEENFELTKLAQYGCDAVQGFYYSKPLTMEEFTAFSMGDTSINAVIKMHALHEKEKNRIEVAE